jgi:hypothetical protein
VPGSVNWPRAGQARHASAAAHKILITR